MSFKCYLMPVYSLGPGPIFFILARDNEATSGCAINTTTNKLMSLNWDNRYTKLE